MDVESTSAAAPPQGAAARRPIGEFLVERGLVTDEQLKQALAEQRSSGKRLGEILVERGAITRMALASVLGEQWEEAGRHLRAVVPVRLAGGKEADAGLAGGEELTDSLASLQAAVARLEELSGGPGSERVVVGDEAIEASFAGLVRQLADLREAVAAPMVVETDHLGERLGELDAFLRSRDEQLDATLSALAEAATRVPTVEPDPAIGERLDRIDAWLRESQVGLTTAIDPEVAERLGRVEALLVERNGAEHLAPELARRLDEIEAAATRERPVVDLTPIEHRLDALGASVAAALDTPVDEAPSEALVARLESLEESLGAVRTAVEAPRDDRVSEALLAGFDELREILRRHDGPPAELTARLDGIEEAAVERLGRLEGAVREALGRPVAEVSAELAGRFGSLEQRLEVLREAVESTRDAGAAERLGPLEDGVRQLLARPGGEAFSGEELVGRLEALQAVVAGLERTDGAARWEELAERFAALEHGVQELRVSLDGQDRSQRLADLERGVHERLGRLEGAVREALGRPVAEVSAELAGRFGALEQRLEMLREAVESTRDAGAAERLGPLEDGVRELLARPGGEAFSGEELVGRLEALQAVVAGLERTDGAARWEELAERFGSFEHGVQELRVSLDGQDGSQRLAELERGVHERLGRLEEAIRESTPAPADGRLDEVLGSLGELRHAVASSTDDAVVHRLDGLEHMIREAVASTETGPTRDDGALHERLDRIDAALATPTASLEQLVARSHNEITERIGELEQALTSPSPEADFDVLAERDARIAELVEQLHARPAAVADTRPRPGDTTSFLALVPASDGYRLVALEGTLPSAGDDFAVPDDDRALVVARLGRSPYPGDARPCAYLQAA